MYKEAVRDWSQADSITMEQYLYVRNGLKNNNINAGVSPHELKCFGINKIKKGWLKEYAKKSFPIEMAKAAAIEGMNVKDQTSHVKSRLRAAFFMGDFDEQMIYLMKNSSGTCKIGRSNSPKDRKKAIQTASGVRVELIACWKVKDKSSLVESELHRHFKSSRLIGEWFDGDCVSIELIEKAMKCKFERVAI